MTEPAPGAPRVWKEPFLVRAYEVGPDERASVLALVDYCQEAAGYHARALGVERFVLPSGPGHWVLGRFRLAVERFPAMREAVTVETWPAAEDGLRAERDFVLLGEDAEPFARATSTWLVLDVGRRRPVRLPGEVRSIRLPERPRAMAPPPEEPSAPSPVTETRPFRVRRADRDRVGHANNARFVEWALEAVPDGFFEAHRLTALDVVFRGEAHAGDLVVSEAGPAGEAAWTHGLRRAADGQTLGVLQSRWAPIA